MLFSYVGGQQRISDNKKCRQIAGYFNCHVDVAVQCRGALPGGAHPGLHSKPLDATIGRVPEPYHPGGRHGQ